MRILAAALLALASLLGVPPGAARADVPVPALKARVTDLTGTLNAQQKADLESRIAAYEARRGSQIAVLILPSTKPEEIEQYSIRVAEAWKIGRKGIDDGLLLTVAKDDRRLRIDVGYGLEGAIPDSVASRVIEERIVPRFRDGDFYGGIRDGVDQLIRLAEGEKLPAPAAPVAGREPPIGFLQFFVGNPVFLLFLAMIGGAILKAVLGRFPGSLATAAGMGLIVFALYGIAMGILAAVAAFVLTFTNTGTGSGGGRSSGGGSWGGGSWSSGSSGGSSWGGGGGGGFGGGGASGRW
jgi:uncharacterized protein